MKDKKHIFTGGKHPEHLLDERKPCSRLVQSQINHAGGVFPQFTLSSVSAR